MPLHDIIDNRNEKLVDNINRILDSTDRARFAVGYFFLSGLTAIGDKLSKVKELRLLIGNTTNRETLEQIAEGYKRLDLVREEAEDLKYTRRTDQKVRSDQTAENLRLSMELMDQTDEGEELIVSLVRLIEEKKLKVKVYTKGRLHAKAYIFDYGKVFDAKGHPVERHEKGIAVVGSSNLTLSGVSHNTELNVLVQGNDNHTELVKWFEELWDDSLDFDETLMNEMKQSWAAQLATPHDIYMKTLYTLVKDRLGEEDHKEVLWETDIKKQLADFQKVAVRQGVQLVEKYGGAFIADVVGLGKSFIGAAIIKQFSINHGLRPLIICPASLKEMWETYDEKYKLNAKILSIGLLKEGYNYEKFLDPEKGLYYDRNFVLVDESHNFRSPTAQRYSILQNYLGIPGRYCCFLTATPRAKSSMDLYHQIKLFHQDDVTDLPIDPPNLKKYFDQVEKGEKRLQDLLVHILYRRTRLHILKWYGYDSETHKKVNPNNFQPYKSGERKAYVIVGGRHQYFPQRHLNTIEYNIEDTYQGLYQKLRGYLGKARKRQLITPIQDELSYARYGLWHYVKKQYKKVEPYDKLHRAGVNLRGLMRVLLFKRFESSVYAFRQSIKKLLAIHENFLKALDEGIVPAGEEAQSILYESDHYEHADLMALLQAMTGKYKADDFETDLLKLHLEHDINLFRDILCLVEPITPDKDAKLQKLIEVLSKKPLSEGKRLIFTQYADTAKYLYENLNPNEIHKDMDVIYSGEKSKVRIVGRFAPKANPEYNLKPGEELFTLIATDVLAEGLNMQDCDKIINYDLHWNPIRLIQRFGRIDRIGSEFDKIHGYNFLPELGIDKQLGLKKSLVNRIQEIHDTIGEDAQILDPSERLNEDAMYAIYEKSGGQLDMFEDDEGEFIDLNEAEEMLRQLQKDDPDEFNRIANLRDGIRSIKSSSSNEMFVFCESFFPNNDDVKGYQQLYLLDEKGAVISKDISKILKAIQCEPDKAITDSPLTTRQLPEGYNATVMRVKKRFNEEVQHRQVARRHSRDLNLSQRYIIRELGLYYKEVEDEDTKQQITILEKAFRTTTTQAVNRELNIIRRNGLTGQNILTTLIRVYNQHNLRLISDRPTSKVDTKPVVKVICSEKLG